MTLKAVPTGGLPTLRKLARAIPLLVAAALAAGCSRGVDGRLRALYEQKRHPDDRARVRIERALQDPDRDVRATALVVMHEIDPERAARMAGTAIDDEDAIVRGAAVGTLADRVDPGHPDPELLGRLAKLAAGDPAWQVRVRALEALASVSDPAVGEAFGRALGDTVRHVRRLALEVAKEHPGLGSVDKIAELAAKDPDWENRVAAAEALGAATDSQAYVGLDAARHDPNEFVRATAARALREVERAGVARPAPPPPPSPPPGKPAPAAKGRAPGV